MDLTTVLSDQATLGRMHPGPARAREASWTMAQPVLMTRSRAFKSSTARARFRSSRIPGGTMSPCLLISTFPGVGVCCGNWSEANGRGDYLVRGP